jgi:hypothetical protein
MPPSKNISFDELSKYFHLPINQVAKELGVCATILKKICRRNGIPRWPHRKIKSLDKMIGNLNMNFSKNPQEREDIHKEIELLQTKKQEILKNPDILAKGQSGEYTPIRHKGPKLHHKSTPYAKRISGQDGSYQRVSLVDESLDDAERMGAAVLSCFAPMPSSSSSSSMSNSSPSTHATSSPVVISTPTSSSSVSISSLVSPVQQQSTPLRSITTFAPIPSHHATPIFPSTNNTLPLLSLPPPPSGRPTGMGVQLVSTCRTDITNPQPNSLGLNFMAPTSTYNNSALPSFKYDGNTNNNNNNNNNIRHNITVTTPSSRAALPILEPSVSFGANPSVSGLTSDYMQLPSWFHDEKNRLASVRQS